VTKEKVFYAKAHHQQAVFLANGAGCLFIPIFSCVLFAKRAACGFVGLWIDGCCRGSGVGSGPSRKSCLAGDLDDCIDIFCSARSLGGRGW
jgi:hypothetical protein